PGDPTRVFSGRRLVVERSPGVAQLVRRVGLENFAVRPLLLAVRRPADERAAGRERGLDVAAVEVLARELGLRDGVPDLFRGRLDEDGVDLHVCLRHRAHPASSSSCLRSASADTRCLVYLSIHRSWIRRMGTGLRKCNFERPTRCVVTSPASSRTRRCFITPKRDISNARSISPSDWPSRSKRPSRIARRVGSASARKTASSMGSRTGDPSVTLPMVSLYVTRGSHVKPFSVHAVSELLEDDVAADPLEQFRRWFAEADEDNRM